RENVNNRVHDFILFLAGLRQRSAAFEVVKKGKRGAARGCGEGLEGSASHLYFFIGLAKLPDCWVVEAMVMGLLVLLPESKGRDVVLLRRGGRERRKVVWC